MADRLFHHLLMDAGTVFQYRLAIRIVQSLHNCDPDTQNHMTLDKDGIQ
jgi:hypothetical protein